MTLIKNNRGVSLFEMLVAILIGSIVISMLMSVLVMGISAKAKSVESILASDHICFSDQIVLNVQN